MTEIKLYNTATRSKERFEPIDPEHVRVYVCGPTVYDRAHLGNGRSAVAFDVLARLLRHAFPRVTYVRNITDVDDKINARAAETGREISDITTETTGWYHEDMDALGVARPDAEPRCTQYIDQMIAMSADLIEKGHAYAAEGHVLFRVRSYEAYGKLSGRSVDDMIAGARVEVAPFKEDPMDFVLWKPAGDGPGWESPWGKGRPGWHIECSAMAKELLGETFDIHGGGLDLQFPHHENEIAQSVCAHGAPMANFWMHNEMLQVEGKKMSKSLGNFFTVRELLDQGYPGEVIRFVLLSTHYRKPMDWTEKKAEEADNTVSGWAMLLHQAGYSRNMVNLLRSKGEWLPDTLVLEALGDDLNTPKAISRLHALAKLGSAVEMRSFAASVELMGIVTDWNNLGLLIGAGVTTTGDQSDIEKKVVALLLDRQEARRSKNWDKADKIRSGLARLGIVIEDSSVTSEFKIDWPAAGSQMLAEKNDGRFTQHTGLDREEIGQWLMQELEVLL